MLHISATGHRPDKLGGYENCDKHRAIRRHMRDLLTKLRDEHGEITIYSGGALGIDQFWMEVGHFLEVPVVAILPFPGFDSVWPKDSRLLLQGMLDNCSEVRYTFSEQVTERSKVVSALMERNKCLIDNCDLLVAYWNGTKGGTANAVRFAQSIKKTVQIYNTDLIV